MAQRLSLRLAKTRLWVWILLFAFYRFIISSICASLNMSLVEVQQHCWFFFKNGCLAARVLGKSSLIRTVIMAQKTFLSSDPWWNLPSCCCSLALQTYWNSFDTSAAWEMQLCNAARHWVMVCVVKCILKNSTRFILVCLLAANQHVPFFVWLE